MPAETWLQQPHRGAVDHGQRLLGAARRGLIFQERVAEADDAMPYAFTSDTRKVLPARLDRKPTEVRAKACQVAALAFPAFRRKGDSGSLAIAGAQRGLELMRDHGHHGRLPVIDVFQLRDVLARNNVPLDSRASNCGAAWVAGGAAWGGHASCSVP